MRYSKSCFPLSSASGYTVPVLRARQTVLIEYRSPLRDRASTFFVPAGALCRFGRPDVRLKWSITRDSPISPIEKATPRRFISTSNLARNRTRSSLEKPSRSTRHGSCRFPLSATLLFTIHNRSLACPVWFTASAQRSQERRSRGYR